MSIRLLHEICGKCLRRQICVVAVSCLTAPSWAMTLEGFVTKVNSQAEFEVGSKRILLNATTQCNTKLLLSDIVLARRTVFPGIPVHNSFVLHDNRAPKSEQSASCSNRAWTIGSRVVVRGKCDTSAGFCTATQVTTYIATIDPGVPTVGRYDPWHGLSLIEENPQVVRTTNGYSGAMWLDGYPSRITSGTSFLATPHMHRMDGGGGTIADGLPTEKSSSQGADPALPKTLLQTNTWAQYRGVGVDDSSVSVYRIRLWPNEVSMKEKKLWARLAPVIHAPDYDSNKPGTVRFTDLQADQDLVIPADRGIQDAVSKLGMSLVPLYQAILPDSDSTKVHFRFYVVQPRGRTLDYEMTRLDGLSFLDRPSWDEAIVSLPDGLILVPQTTLTRISNQAQLAAVISYAITSVLQHKSYIVRPALIGAGYDDAFVAVLRYEQILRIGIRQMYLAGYDIREAPFAWAVARGLPVINPIMNSKAPDKVIPWYAAYAINYISQYYKEVDYSKLKRGEAEYRQFLGELRKADPEAFGDGALQGKQ